MGLEEPHRLCQVQCLALSAKSVPFLQEGMELHLSCPEVFSCERGVLTGYLVWKMP